MSVLMLVDMLYVAHRHNNLACVAMLYSSVQLTSLIKECISQLINSINSINVRISCTSKCTLFYYLCLQSHEFHHKQLEVGLLSSLCLSVCLLLLLPLHCCRTVFEYTHELDHSRPATFVCSADYNSDRAVCMLPLDTPSPLC